MYSSVLGLYTSIAKYYDICHSFHGGTRVWTLHYTVLYCTVMADSPWPVCEGKLQSAVSNCGPTWVHCWCHPLQTVLVQLFYLFRLATTSYHSLVMDYLPRLNTPNNCSLWISVYSTLVFCTSFIQDVKSAVGAVYQRILVKNIYFLLLPEEVFLFLFLFLHLPVFTLTCWGHPDEVVITPAQFPSSFTQIKAYWILQTVVWGLRDTNKCKWNKFTPHMEPEEWKTRGVCDTGMPNFTNLIQVISFSLIHLTEA